MKKRFAIYSFILLVISFFIPLGTADNKVITLLPVFDNFVIESVNYEWITTAAFTITLLIIAPLILYFNSKGYSFGLNISGGIMIVCTFFLFAAMFITFHEAAKAGITNTSYGYGYITLIAGTIFSFLAAKNLSNK